MYNDGDLHRVAEGCLVTHKLLKQSGTPLLQTISRLLLLEVGREVVARASASHPCISKKIIPREASNIRRIVLLLKIGGEIASEEDLNEFMLPARNNAREAIAKISIRN